MLILTLRTDKPESEIGLYEDERQLVYEVWEAHRRLAETIHQKIEEVLNQQKLQISDIQGLVVYSGPGSFTGLRIGTSVMNSLAYSLNVPIVGRNDNWVELGIEDLKSGKNDKIALPDYGQSAHITKPKK